MAAYTAAILTISDKGFRGERADTSGPALKALLEEAGWDVVHTAILPDELEQKLFEIRDALLHIVAYRLHHIFENRIDALCLLCRESAKGGIRNQII